MKAKLITLLAALLFCDLRVQAQSTTTFTITVQAPPSCTVTLASNPASASGANLYSGQVGVINFNISSCNPASASATATWDGTALVLTYKAASGSTPASMSVAVTAAEATVGSHALVLTIPFPVLALNTPVTLPNGKVGTNYSANLAALANVRGGVPPYNFSATASSLPPGLSLSSSGVVSGVPSSAGSFNFSFTVNDSVGSARLRGRARADS